MKNGLSPERCGLSLFGSDDTIIFSVMNMIGKDIMESLHEEAKIFRLLNHSTRIAILEILRGGEECVCHLEAILGCRQAYLSQQLSVLRAAGIIQERREGWNRFYRVARLEIYPLLDTVRRLIGEPVPAMPERISSPKCSCPKCCSKGHITSKN